MAYRTKEGKIIAYHTGGFTIPISPEKEFVKLYQSGEKEINTFELFNTDVWLCINEEEANILAVRRFDELNKEEKQKYRKIIQEQTQKEFDDFKIMAEKIKGENINKEKCFKCGGLTGKVLLLDDFKYKCLMCYGKDKGINMDDNDIMGDVYCEISKDFSREKIRFLIDCNNGMSFDYSAYLLLNKVPKVLKPIDTFNGQMPDSNATTC